MKRKSDQHPERAGLFDKTSAPFSWISTWQNLVGLFASTPAIASHGVDLQALEERVLYDASPLMAIAHDLVGEHLDHQVDSHLDDLSELCFQAGFDYPTDGDGGFDTFCPIDTALSQFEEVDQNWNDRQLVVIDGRIDDFESLINDIVSKDGTPYDVLVLDSAADGIAQISAYLENELEYQAIHLVAHGRDASLQLGSTNLAASNLVQYEDQLTGWAAGLTADGDILIYGCNVAQSADGRWLVDQIGQFTGADIAASDDLTGNRISGW